MEFLKESVDYAIFFILGLMGFVSIWLTIERVMFLRKVNPSDYPTKDEYDAALTNNLYDPLHHLFQRTVCRSSGHGHRHHDYVL